MATILSACLGGRVLTPDYRLAPEHPFPAAILDGVAVYEDLIEDGTAPGAIAFGGDSAGGGLVLAILLAIRERGLPLPSAAVCVSPWVDLTTSGLDALDPQVTSGRLEEMAGWYIGSADPGDPLASPLRADLTGLPPLLIQVGGSERLALDGERLAEVARKGGVEVSFESWADMIHVWHAFAPRLEEGTSALRMIARWLVERWNQRAGE
jgi:acetyl esterase/lipase